MVSDLNNDALQEKYKTSVDLAVSLVSKNIFPLIVIDKDFKVEHISDGCYTLLYEYYNLSLKSFFDIFEIAFQSNELTQCIESLKDVDAGYTWKGILLHSIRTAPNIRTRTTFLPLFENQSIAGYYVIFEDITKEYLHQRLAIIQGLMNAAKIKDRDTGLHTERVNYYSKAIAEHVYTRNLFPKVVDVNFVEDIGRYASMHDIGKIGTPDHILQKPTQLTEDEWKIIQEHTINGAMILSGFAIPMAQEIALSHHERWNGSGYPFRMVASMIPLSARIVALCDVYDALRMKRPYKEALAHEECINYIISESETQFDPVLTNLLKDVHNDLNRIWLDLKDKSNTIERHEHM